MCFQDALQRSFSGRPTVDQERPKPTDVYNFPALAVFNSVCPRAERERAAAAGQQSAPFYSLAGCGSFFQALADLLRVRSARRRGRNSIFVTRLNFERKKRRNSLALKLIYRHISSLLPSPPPLSFKSFLNYFAVIGKVPGGGWLSVARRHWIRWPIRSEIISPFKPGAVVPSSFWKSANNFYAALTHYLMAFSVDVAVCFGSFESSDRLSQPPVDSRWGGLQQHGPLVLISSK